MPVSLRFLRSASLLLFALSVLFLLFSTLVDFAPHKIKVYNPDHQVIGTASIPTNDSGVIILALIFFTLSGLQLWTVSAICRSLRHQSPAPAAPDES